MSAQRSLVRGLLVAVDSVDGRVVRSVEGLGHPGAIAVGFGSVWVYEYREGVVARVDGATGRVIAKMDVPAPDGTARATGCAGVLAVGSHAVWVPLAQYRGIARIDPATSTARAIALDAPAAHAYADADGVWVVGAVGLADAGAVVEQLDQVTGAVITAWSVPYALDAATTGDVIWVGTAEDQSGGTVLGLAAA